MSQKISAQVAALKEAADYLMGRSDSPTVRGLPATASIFWGLWWGVLLAVALVFCGQSSKFIYIDF